jgi:hypothetical protein
MLNKIASAVVLFLDRKLNSLVDNIETGQMHEYVLNKLQSGKPLSLKDLSDMKYSQIDILITCEGLERLGFIKKYQSPEKLNGKLKAGYCWQITTKGISHFREVTNVNQR